MRRTSNSTFKFGGIASTFCLALTNVVSACWISFLIPASLDFLPFTAFRILLTSSLKSVASWSLFAASSSHFLIFFARSWYCFDNFSASRFVALALAWYPSVRFLRGRFFSWNSWAFFLASLRTFLNSSYSRLAAEYLAIGMRILRLSTLAIISFCLWSRSTWTFAASCRWIKFVRVFASFLMSYSIREKKMK